MACALSAVAHCDCLHLGLQQRSDNILWPPDAEKQVIAKGFLVLLSQ